MDARLTPGAVDNLEMHGTGTPLGDPIEVGAALAVLSVPHKEQPLNLSAVKSMMGHSEPAAGAASMWHMVSRLMPQQFPCCSCTALFHTARECE